MSFGSDLLIDPEISRACESMLGFSPEGRNAAQVFSRDDPAKTELFCSIIAAVLAEPDPDIRESMLSLLPAEISRDGVLLRAEYKPLENGRFMAVLTDITEERRLEALLQSERRRLEFIVLAVSDKRNFFDAIEVFRDFLSNGLTRTLNVSETESPQILASRLYREIHTYKGLLNQFSFINTPKVLHEIETALSGLLSLGDTLTRQGIADIVSPHLLEPPFDEDLAVLTNALGKEFLEHGKGIVLSRGQASALEKLAERLLQGDVVDTSALEIRTLLNDIAALRKVTLKAVLMDFDGLVKQVAERQGKEVGPIEVLGGADIWIDPQPYQAFFHSLGHIFRNTVIHGVETPEVRWSAQKNDHGKITCRVELERNAIKLSIADDGAGIDLDALRDRAVAAGIHAADEAGALSDEEIASLIFRDNMSTRNTVTDLSGRGVGLAAVLSETRKLGGEVVVRTAAGQGTQFLFRLPLQQGLPVGSDATALHGKLNDDVEFVMRSIIAKTRDYFESEHGTSVAELDSEGGESRGLGLLDMTAIIGMGGRVNLWVAFSLEEGLVNAVYEWMSAGFDDHPEEAEKYREAAIGEMVNTILGHCTMDIQHLDRQGISMTPPVILGRGKPIPSMDNAMHYTQSLSTALGRLDISIVGPREIIDTNSD